MIKPPKTRRYCLVCDKTTEFEYMKALGHSECVECGGRFAINPDYVDMLRKKWEEELDAKISEQYKEIIFWKEKFNKLKNG